MLNRQGAVYIKSSKDRQQYLDHKRLFDVLQKCKFNNGSWILSYGGDSDISMYKKFKIIRLKIATTTWSKSTESQAPSMLEEYLILSN